jgi:hypothetical protein
MILIKRFTDVENYQSKLRDFIGNTENPFDGFDIYDGNTVLSVILPILNPDNSIFLLDDENIVGCLTATRDNMSVMGTTSYVAPRLEDIYYSKNNQPLNKKLFIEFNYFYIKPEYRRNRNDYKMCSYVFFNMVKDNYQFITLGVIDQIKTHNYWKKFFNFQLLLSIAGSKYYYLDTATILKEFKIHNKKILLENKIRTLVKEYINPYMLKAKYLTAHDEEKPYALGDKEKDIIKKWDERSYTKNNINIELYNSNKELLNISINKTPISTKIIKDNNKKTLQLAVTYSCIINNSNKEVLFTIRNTVKKNKNDKTNIYFVLYDNFNSEPNNESLLTSKSYNRYGTGENKTDLLKLIQYNKNYLSSKIEKILAKDKILKDPFTQEDIYLYDFYNFYNIDPVNYHIS